MHRLKIYLLGTPKYSFLNDVSTVRGHQAILRLQWMSKSSFSVKNTHSAIDKTNVIFVSHKMSKLNNSRKQYRGLMNFEWSLGDSRTVVWDSTAGGVSDPRADLERRWTGRRRSPCRTDPQRLGTFLWKREEQQQEQAHFFSMWVLLLFITIIKE